MTTILMTSLSTLYLQVIAAVIEWTVIKGGVVRPNFMRVTTNQTTAEFCIWEYVTDRTHAKGQHWRNTSYELVIRSDLNAEVLCAEEASKESVNLSGKVVLTKQTTNCSTDKQIGFFANKSIIALIMSVKCDTDFAKDVNISQTNVDRNGFAVAFITEQSSSQLNRSLTNQMVISELSDDQKPSILVALVFLCVAVFTTAVGALWSGRIRYQIFVYRHSLSAERVSTPSKQTVFKEETSLELTPLEIIGLVIFMSVVLILFYFFWEYLIFLQLFLFFAVSTIAVFVCVEPLINKALPKSWCKKSFQMCDTSIPQYYLVVALIALMAALFWFLTRHQSYSWLTQDILGILICIFAIKTLRLPSLMIILILLWLLFVYDIVMVFVTPLFTKGQSVMERVATGGHSGLCVNDREKMPFVIRIPTHVFTSDKSIVLCLPNASAMLGFGDIVVPGILVAYCYAFDLIFRIKFPVYFIVSLTGYGLGMMATFISLYLMSMAQPALLFLVPFTTIPVLAVGLCRRELSRLWIRPEEYFFSQTKGSHHDITTTDEKLANETKNN